MAVCASVSRDFEEEICAQNRHFVYTEVCDMIGAFGGDIVLSFVGLLTASSIKFMIQRGIARMFLRPSLTSSSTKPKTDCLSSAVAIISRVRSYQYL